MITSQVVLVRPDDSANIGAVCRAMKSMGIYSLSLVNPRTIDEKRLRTLAIHAYDVYESSSFYSNLDEALSESVLSAGFTRRKGRWRKYFSLPLESFIEKTETIQEGTLSLVFGNEEQGLRDDELRSCDLSVRIPSSQAFPSLNLSHAVQIVCYLLFRSSSYRESKKNEDEQILYSPIIRKEVAGLTEEITNSLETVGFFTLTGKKEMEIFLRDILSRALLDRREADRLASIFRKIAGLVGHSGYSAKEKKSN